MKTIEIVRQQSMIKQLIRRAGHDASTKDLEMLAHWGKYVCVITSGYTENIVRVIYGAYIAKTTTSQPTKKFAQKQLDDVQNPKAERLVSIASSFEKNWGTALESFLNDNFRREAINSIMGNRHLIVHGRDSNITLARVDQYFKRISEVAEFIEDQCGL